MDEIKVPAGQRPDISYGRKIDGKDEWGILNKVTPSTNNLTLDSNEKIENFKTNDSSGMGMTITAMAVVFIGLLLLFLVFKFVGKAAVSMSMKRAKKAGVEHISPKGEMEEGAVFAAIATALHEVTEDVHDIESTVITIQKVTRRYSPWSSKIYGLRDQLKR